MLSEDIKLLILDEKSRERNFASENVDDYVAKLIDNAEFITSFRGEVCQGFVAYYCNDLTEQVAYITLVLVTPICRRAGLGQSLVRFVLDHAKKKGFRRCRLEVNLNNKAGLALYQKLGFRIVEDQVDKILLEVNL